MLWEVPSSLLPGLVQRNDVTGLWLQTATTTRKVSTDPYPTLGLDDTLDDVAQAHAAGVPAGQAALYALLVKGENILITVTAPDVATETSIRNWLTTRGVFLHPQTQSSVRNTLYIDVVTPVGQILPLAQAYPAAKVRTEPRPDPSLTLSRAHWPAWFVQDVLDAVNWWARDTSAGASGAADTPQSTGADPNGCPGSPHAGVSSWKTDLASRQAFHCVTPWHDAGIDGEGVSVGIIDWGFAGYDLIPSLCNLHTAPDTTLGISVNAFCQDPRDGIWPSSRAILGEDCMPVPLGGSPLNHGTNVAELIVDMAPKAKLFLAQANSPQQVKAAADWLANREVDIIVHAAGWPYDGPGDGSSFLTAINAPAELSSDDRHSPVRYHPSPLNTVDQIIQGPLPIGPQVLGAPQPSASGPVWVAPAGNQDTHTMFTDNITLLPDGYYQDFMVFHPLEEEAKDKICQSLPQVNGSMNIYSLRWADSWPNAMYDLDFVVAAPGYNPVIRSEGIRDAVYISSRGTAQLPLAQGVRRAVHLNTLGTDLCLYIKVNSYPEGAPPAPDWLQFQWIEGSDSAFETVPSWARDTIAGRSIINPSESQNLGMLTVGARDLTQTGATMARYSSRGPVFAPTTDTRGTILDVDQPDAVAGTGAITYLKWADNCLPAGVPCDDPYFKGTSGASAHTAGLAVLTVDWLKTLGGSYTPGDVVTMMKDNAAPVDLGGAQGAVLDNPTPGESILNQWGSGTLKMPDCVPTVIAALPYIHDSSFAAGDCLSERRVWGDIYSHYYTLTLDAPVILDIELEKTDSSYLDPYLYIENGAYGTGSYYLFQNDDEAGSGGLDARILTTELPAGTYTIEATAGWIEEVGDFRLTVSKVCITDCDAAAAASLSPDPSMAINIFADGSWHDFTVAVNMAVRVVTNPTGQPVLIELTKDASAGNLCEGEQDDNVYAVDGDIIRLAGCQIGVTTVEIVELTDFTSVLASYYVTVRPVPDRASFDREPSTDSFIADGAWHDFVVTSNVPVFVQANPIGSTARVEITHFPTVSNHCPPNDLQPESVAIVSGGIVYLSGCSVGQGQVQVVRQSDQVVLADYTFDIAAPAVIAPTASLYTDPETFVFDTLGTWHGFTLTSSETVKMVANPVTYERRLEITAISGAGNHCLNGAEEGDGFEAPTGTVVYLAGCEAGTARLEIRRISDDSLVHAYDITIPAPAPVVPQVCNPVTNFAVTVDRSALTFTATWDNPTPGLAVEGHTLRASYWDAGAWVSLPNANIPLGSIRFVQYNVPLTPSNTVYVGQMVTHCAGGVNADGPWIFSSAARSSGDGPGGAVGPTEPETPPSPKQLVPPRPKVPGEELPPPPFR